MNEMNRRAMYIPRERLLDEIKEANFRKQEILDWRDQEFGVDRPRIGSYMENIALPDLYGFDANDYYRNAQLAMDIDLRNKLFWLDNSHDDGLASLEVSAGSMYYDMTLFGLHINYQKDGVPVFDRHILADNPDFTQLQPFDFYKTGEMPIVHKRYQELKHISEDLYNNEIQVSFPHFHRGPLDIYMQLREYDGFVEDCAENPDYVHHLIDYIVSERHRFNQLASEFRGEEQDKTTFIADDWVNVPFISPTLFDEFAAPAYRKIQKNEGSVTGFHTCGILVPVAKNLLEIFTEMEAFDVSGWNDVTELDALVKTDITFQIAYINTFVLMSGPDEHRIKLLEAKEVAKHRKISLNSQAIVKIFNTIDESLFAMNRFIDLARDIMAE